MGKSGLDQSVELRLQQRLLNDLNGLFAGYREPNLQGRVTSFDCSFVKMIQPVVFRLWSSTSQALNMGLSEKNVDTTDINQAKLVFDWNMIFYDGICTQQYGI